MHPLKAPSGNQCFHILPSPQGRPSVPASWDSPNPFDSALPCSNPLPSAGQAGVTCSDLSGLSCLPLPPPPPPPTSQLPCCYQAVASEVSQGPGGHWRHLALLRSRSLQHQGLPPRRTACDSLSLSTCPSSSCMPTRCLPQDAKGVAIGWEPEGRGPPLRHSYSCYPLLQPGHTGGSFQISSRSPFAMINIPFPLKQSFAKLAGARGNLARSCEPRLNLPNGLKKNTPQKQNADQSTPLPPAEKCKVHLNSAGLQLIIISHLWQE